MKKRYFYTFIITILTVFYLYNVIGSAATIPIVVNIETPMAGEVIDNSSFDITGTASSTKGVKYVNIYIDSKFKGKATYVAATSKFTYHYTAIKNGDHKLSVVAYSKDGKKLQRDVSVTVARLVPMLSVEKAVQVGNSLNIVGWSLNNTGVKEVQVLLDGKLKGTATYGIERNDVDSNYPGYTNGNLCGFTYNIDLIGTTLGTHKVSVISIGVDGSKQQVDKSFVLKTKAAFTKIEAPTENYSLSGNTLNISGFVLSPVGVKSVAVYFDGKFKGNAQTGIARNDVAASYPGFTKSSTSGFTYSIDLRSENLGTHKISIVQIAADGTKLQSDRNFTLLQKAPLMAVDTPINNTELIGNSINLKGWALNPSGIAEVQIQLDGKKIGSANYGTDSTALNNQYPGFPNGDKAAFDYSVDLKGAALGAHKITINALGVDGTKQLVDKAITIKKKIAATVIESPKELEDISNNYINVSGFSLSPVGVSSIAVSFDGKPQGSATYGGDRPDIEQSYVGFLKPRQSGFTYGIDLKTIAPGAHKISITATFADGTTQKVDRSFNIVRKTPVLAVEAPIAGTSSTARDMTISGFALNDSGIKEINIYMNNQLITKTTDGTARTDIDALYPNFTNGKTSGFSYSFNIMKLLSTGNQSVEFKTVAIGFDGTSSTVTTVVVINKQAENMLLETPLNTAVVKNNISVTGWALNASGVISINIYLDGTQIANGSYGTSRSDVDALYPGYTDGFNCGFSYIIDASKVPSGNHSVKVEAVGNDGKVTSQTAVFNLYGIVTFENYNYTLTTMVTTQSTVGAVYQGTTGWTPATQDMIKQYADTTTYIDDAKARYMFLQLNYNDGYTVNDLNKILTNKGVLSNKGQVFIDAGKQNNVNPIYLISHALLETGSGTSRLATGITVSTINGTAVNPVTVYNMFGIQAYDSDPNRYGSEYAYNQGWDTVDKAIMGGAYFISKDYVNNTKYKQNTLYKMRWNPAKPGTHQYATDIRWAYNQVGNIQKLISLCSESVLNYNIPVYLPEQN